MFLVSVCPCCPSGTGQGYKVQGEAQEATVVAVTDDGAVIDEPVENILMRKSLKV